MALTKDQLEKLSVTDALSLSFDDVPEGFKLWPKGIYKAQVSIKAQQNKDGVDQLVFTFLNKEVLEKALETDEDLPLDAEMSKNYSLPKGLIGVRKDYGQIAKELGASEIKEFIQKFQGCMVAITVGHQIMKGKALEDGTKEDDKVFAELKAISLVQ